MQYFKKLFLIGVIPLDQKAADGLVVVCVLLAYGIKRLPSWQGNRNNGSDGATSGEQDSRHSFSSLQEPFLRSTPGANTTELAEGLLAMMSACVRDGLFFFSE